MSSDYAGLFATLIARTAKDIDALIESLPADDASLDGQVQSLSRLEQENQVRVLKRILMFV